MTGSPDTYSNNLSILRGNCTDIGTHCCCCGPNIWGTLESSQDVYVNNQGVVRLGDRTWCCGGIGSMITSSENVIANG